MNELLGWYGYGSSRDDTRNRVSSHSHPGSNSSGTDSPKYAEGCEWCGKSIEEGKSLSSSGATFCSELCFSQSRRANFKRNKTCDWCRHVRHTVSYVDFQDGACQLQFCSDKCLNQYKMHIFCRETRAHLEMHPHLSNESLSTGSLITPELWLKNCKSPETHSSSRSVSPKHHEDLPQTSPLPLISVAHPSKILANPHNGYDFCKRQRTKVQRKNRKKVTVSSTCQLPPKTSPIEGPQDLRVRHTPPVGGFENWIFQGQISSSSPSRESLFRSSTLFESSRPHNYPVSSGRPEIVTGPSNGASTLLPPVTILVPYPILIPLPLPIPIPVPMSTIAAMNLNSEINGASSDCDSPAAQTEGMKQESKEGKENIENSEKLSEKETESNGIDNLDCGGGRPLRKRKKMFETKSKVGVNKSVKKSMLPV